MDFRVLNLQKSIILIVCRILKGGIMDDFGQGLKEYVESTAKELGAVTVGFTKIRVSQPVIIYGFP